MEEVNRYNLALGSVVNGKEDYEHQSRNNDINKIFGTVALIAEHFFSNYPDAEIYLEGNTDAKTRAYQMQLNRKLE